MGTMRELEVEVLSAQALKNVKLTGTMAPYCVAWVYPHTKVAGPVCKGGGVNPVWNSTIRVPVFGTLVDQADAYVAVEIYNHGKFMIKFIGSAIVPLADTKSSQSGGSSYQVRTKSGKHMGDINIAVKVRTLTEEEVARINTPPVLTYPAYSQQARRWRSSMGGGAGVGMGSGLFGGLDSDMYGGGNYGGCDGGFGGGGGGGGCGGGGGGGGGGFNGGSGGGC